MAHLVRRSRRWSRVTALAAVVLTCSSCAIDSPYARSNPFDAEANLVMSLSGPDSVHASGERFTVTIESSAPLPPGPLAVNWLSSIPQMVVPLGGGEFRTSQLSPQYLEVRLTASFDERVLSTTVYVGQRP